MKGEDLRETDLPPQKKSTEILLVALGCASNRIRTQHVILPLVLLIFKVHWSRSYFRLFPCRSVGFVS